MPLLSFCKDIYAIKQRNQTKNETFIFFKITHLAFYTLIPVSFPLFEAPLRFFFWYSMKLYHCISVNLLLILKSGLGSVILSVLKTLYWLEITLLQHVLKKVSRMKLYLLRQKWRMNATLIFFFSFNTYSCEFALFEALLKFFFWYGTNLCHHISFNVLYILKFLLLRWIFSLENKKKLLEVYCTWIILCFIWNCCSKCIKTDFIIIFQFGFDS